MVTRSVNSKIRQSLFMLVAFGLAGVFIGLTFKQTDFQVLKQAAAEANYFWFVLSMALSIVSYWLRAARWRLLLEPIGYETSIKSGFWAISFAYFMNLTIPRSGEIARATSFYKMEKVPVDQSIGTIVLERVIDLLFLGGFFILTLIFNAKTLFSFFSFAGDLSWQKYLTLLGILLVGMLLLYLSRNLFKRFALYKKVVEFIRGIITGFLSILHLKKRSLFVLYSFAIWLCYFLMTYLVVFAFPATLNFGLAEGFFLIVSGALGMILPAVGGLAYPYIMSIAFGAIYLASGQSVEEGKTVGNYFGLMLYFAQIISMIAFGLLSIYFIAKRTAEKA